MRLTWQLWRLSFLAVAMLSVTACNRGPNVEAAREDRQPTVTPAEQDFMMKAAQANLEEINAARLAIQKSQNPDVKDYANMIESDHTSALKDLNDLMKDKGVPQPKVLNEETKREIEKMAALQSPEFDREFANMMVADHEKAIEMFRDQIEIAQNPDVKKYAENLLPTLEMHLEKAQKLQSKLFGGGKR